MSNMSRLGPANLVPVEDADSAGIRRYRLTGDATVFAQIDQRYRRRLEKLVGKIAQSKEIADEVTQTVLIRAWQEQAEFTLGTSFWDWIATIARNLTVDELRHRERNANRDEECGEWIASTEANPEEALLQKEQAESIENMLHSLPALERQAFELRHDEALDYPTIAMMMGCSERVAQRLVKQAREKLERLVREDDEEV